MSKVDRPKQFIDVLGIGRSLLQMTYDRFSRICPKENIYIVSSFLYKDLIKEQLPDISEQQILSEPTRRNTAPCIAYANSKINKIADDANIIVTASDHFIQDEDRFIQTIEQGLKAVDSEDILLTLGIRPTYPNTGYGYIQYMEDDKFEESLNVRKVKLFTEKPSLEMAEKFIESGEFLWNSGIFLWSLKSINQSMQEYLPDVYDIFEQGDKFYNTNKEEDFISKAYTSCPSISIDYGIMEKAKNVYVIPSDFGWSDVGTWGALHEIRDKDEDKNSVIGRNVLLYDTSNSIVNMPKNKLAVIQGLDDYIIVDSNDILMICQKSEEQRIKQFVTDVEVEKGKEFL